MRLSQKIVLGYLGSVHPTWKTFEQIAEELPVMFNFDIFELQDRLNTLCDKGKIEKEFPEGCFRLGKQQRYRIIKERES